MPQSFQRSRSCFADDRLPGRRLRRQPRSNCGIGLRRATVMGKSGMLAVILPGNIGRHVAHSNRSYSAVVIEREQRRILAGLGLAGVGELRVVVRELAVVQPRSKVIGPLGVLGGMCTR